MPTFKLKVLRIETFKGIETFKRIETFNSKGLNCLRKTRRQVHLSQVTCHAVFKALNGIGEQHEKREVLS